MILPTINRTLLPFKAAYFFCIFSYFSVVPFTPVYLRQVGLNAEQTGIINGSRMFMLFLTGPLWGIVADKNRQHRLLLLIQIIGASLFMSIIPWIPKILPNDINTLCTAAAEWGNVTAYQLHQSEIINSTDIFEGVVNKTTGTLNLTLENSNNDNRSIHDNYRSCQDVMNVNVFPMMLIFINIAAIFDGGIPLLLDTLMMERIKRETGSNRIDFGKQRLWGGVGYVCGSVATGFGVQLSGGSKANYLTMFCIYLASNFCLFVVCLKFQQIDREIEKTDVWKGLLYILKHFNATFFYSTIFIEGLSNALLLGFLFWYIKDLRGNDILMGVSNMVSGTSNIIAFVIAERFIKFVGGNLTAIALSIFIYSLRFIAMSYVTNAWHILFLQLSQGINFAILWVAAITHASLLAPPGLTTTFLGILNGIHYGISAGVSIIFGGIFYKRYGGRAMYRGFSIVCAIWSIIVFLFVLARKRREKRKYKLGDNDLTTDSEPEKLLNVSALKDSPEHVVDT